MSYESQGHGFWGNDIIWKDLPVCLLSHTSESAILPCPEGWMRLAVWYFTGQVRSHILVSSYMHINFIFPPICEVYEGCFCVFSMDPHDYVRTCSRRSCGMWKEDEWGTSVRSCQTNVIWDCYGGVVEVFFWLICSFCSV